MTAESLFGLKTIPWSRRGTGLGATGWMVAVLLVTGFSWETELADGNAAIAGAFEAPGLGKGRGDDTGFVTSGLGGLTEGAATRVEVGAGPDNGPGNTGTSSG